MNRVVMVAGMEAVHGLEDGLPLTKTRLATAPAKCPTCQQHKPIVVSVPNMVTSLKEMC